MQVVGNTRYKIIYGADWYRR